MYVIFVVDPVVAGHRRRHCRLLRCRRNSRVHCRSRRSKRVACVGTAADTPVIILLEELARKEKHRLSTVELEDQFTFIGSFVIK